MSYQLAKVSAEVIGSKRYVHFVSAGRFDRQTTIHFTVEQQRDFEHCHAVGEAGRQYAGEVVFRVELVRDEERTRELRFRHVHIAWLTS